MPPSRLHLITGGKYHDFNLARLVMLQIMAEDDRIQATCAQDFSGLDALGEHCGIVLYTCDLMPDEAQTAALDAFVSRGGRLFAVHATNAPINFTDGPAINTSGISIPGLVKAPTPDIAPGYMALLGSRFQSHLGAQPLHIKIEDHDHPVTAGLDDFTVVDEPYMLTPLGDIHVLMSARYKGKAPGYELSDWPDDPPRPQLYVKEHGEGGVLYLTLGHCCGRFDMHPLMVEAPVNRGAWDDPMFRDIVRRGIRWTAGL